MIETDQRQFERWVLTDEGQEVVERGSHEARMFQAVDADGGSPQAELMVSMCSVVHVDDSMLTVCTTNTGEPLNACAI